MKYKKKDLVERIIDDLDKNIYDSKEFLIYLAEEALMKKKISELKEITCVEMDLN